MVGDRLKQALLSFALVVLVSCGGGGGGSDGGSDDGGGTGGGSPVTGGDGDGDDNDGGTGGGDDGGDTGGGGDDDGDTGGGGDDDGDTGGGGDDDGDTGGDSIASIRIVPEAILVAIDMEQPLAATAYDADGNVVNATFEWDISDTRVAITNTNGTKLTGTGVGEATLTARAGGKAASVNVVVVEPVEGKLVAGTLYSCGLTIVGEAWCWGSNGFADSTYGVLGNESAGAVSAMPVRVQGGLRFKDITAGHRHVCGITTDGKAYCWGRNDYNQLGTDAVVDLTYAPVPVKTETRFTSIASANLETCALTEEGETWCWPFEPQAHWNPDPPNVEVPEILPPYKLDGVPPLVEVGLSGGHACGITAEGDAWCWGSNFSGMLGINSTDPTAMAPVQVVGEHVFSTLSVGSTTCGLEEGKPWCWGYGVISDYQHAYQPTAVGTKSFVSLSVSADATYALDAQGDLYWWGYRRACTSHTGGHGCETPENREFRAETPELLDAEYDHASLSVGTARHGMSLTTDGRMTGWGENVYGQAGLGNTDIWWQRNPAQPMEGFTLEVDTTRIMLDPGESVSIPVSVTRHGGFSIYGGAGFQEPISLSTLYLPDGVTATFAPSTLSGSLTQAELILTAGNDAGADSSNISVQASAPGAPMQQAAFDVTVTLPPGEGDDLNLVCEREDTPMPSGYHCMNNGFGNLVPGKYNIPAMHGMWVDTEIGLCLRWGENGDATARFRAPQLGGGSTEVHNGIWGVISRRSGEPEGNETQWYVFTSPADDQTKLLGYDSSTNQIIGWQFVKSSSCPW